jgi:nitrate reductase (cytochrome), electron transfer subunit
MSESADMNELPGQKHSSPVTAQRSLSLFGAIVLGIALVGFLMGILEGFTEVPASARPNGNSHFTGRTDVQPAASYAAMHTATFSPNSDWSSDLKNLKFPRPSRLSPVVRTHAMKLAAIADRATNRAFDGAPPVIPHKVEQQSAASCLVCHGQGMKLGDRIATKISHAHFSSCTQCHVESTSSGPFDAGAEIPNSFAGLSRSGPGTRAFAGSPPTIPHTTWLRDDCMSCHGTIARQGLRTTHPWFTNCTQCHAPSTALDQPGSQAAAVIDHADATLANTLPQKNR